MLLVGIWNVPWRYEWHVRLDFYGDNTVVQVASQFYYYSCIKLGCQMIHYQVSVAGDCNHSGSEAYGHYNIHRWCNLWNGSWVALQWRNSNRNCGWLIYIGIRYYTLLGTVQLNHHMLLQWELSWCLPWIPWYRWGHLACMNLQAQAWVEVWLVVFTGALVLSDLWLCQW